MDKVKNKLLDLSAVNKAIVGGVATFVGLIVYVVFGLGKDFPPPNLILTLLFIILFGAVLGIMIFLYYNFYDAPNSDEKKDDTTLFVNKILYVLWMGIYLFLIFNMSKNFFAGLSGQGGGGLRGGSRGRSWSKRR